MFQNSDKKLKHWARIKVYKNDNSGSFTIKVSDNPEVIGDYSKIVTTKELNLLIEKVKKYKIPLLNFWNNIGDMVVDDLLDQMKQIDDGKKVDIL